jgi:hypothetical protein
MDVYAALGIRKERIHKRQAWENYIEALFQYRPAYGRREIRGNGEQGTDDHDTPHMDDGLQRSAKLRT